MPAGVLCKLLHRTLVGFFTIISISGFIIIAFKEDKTE